MVFILSLIIFTFSFMDVDMVFNISNTRGDTLKNESMQL